MDPSVVYTPKNMHNLVAQNVLFEYQRDVFGYQWDVFGQLNWAIGQAMENGGLHNALKVPLNCNILLTPTVYLFF